MVGALIEIAVFIFCCVVLFKVVRSIVNPIHKALNGIKTKILTHFFGPIEQKAPVESEMKGASLTQRMENQ